MDIKCVSQFRNDDFNDGQTIAPGQVLHLNDVEGQRLLRCSPDSFEWLDDPARVTKKVPEPEPEKVGAMSTETETGIVAPDRRARGGKRRTTKKCGGKG